MANNSPRSKNKKCCSRCLVKRLQTLRSSILSSICFLSLKNRSPQSFQFARTQSACVYSEVEAFFVRQFWDQISGFIWKEATDTLKCNKNRKSTKSLKSSKSICQNLAEELGMVIGCSCPAASLSFSFFFWQQYSSFLRRNNPSLLPGCFVRALSALGPQLLSSWACDYEIQGW